VIEFVIYENKSVMIGNKQRMVV